MFLRVSLKDDLIEAIMIYVINMIHLNAVINSAGLFINGQISVTLNLNCGYFCWKA
jgi:hypothetical protein